MDRSYGVLLALSSLPGKYGIGTMGHAARTFADKLREAGCKYWQMLPLTQQGEDGSPYMSPSAFAGSWNYIDFDLLYEDGLLSGAEREEAQNASPQGGGVDYGALKANRLSLLYPVYAHHWGDCRERVQRFRQGHPWAEDYARVMASREGLEPEFFLLLQTLFTEQWGQLKRYCNERGLLLFGDMPIYVAPGGVEAQCNPELFDRAGRVAGCPPDAFTVTGQFWKNPLYDWAAMKRDGYGWWIRRFAQEFERFDLLRIDHFRGFESYWSIPPGAATAATGRWEQGPGVPLFNTLKAWFGNFPVVAEDLGDLTPSFHAFMEACGFPGMNVLQFAFEPGANSSYLPHNTARHRVVYTGTHDNDTTLGWWRTQSALCRAFADEYLGGGLSEATVADRLMRTAFETVAELAVVPMQDILGLGSEARMNVPGTERGNWRWRMDENAFDAAHAASLRRMGQLYGRNN